MLENVFETTNDSQRFKIGCKRQKVEKRYEPALARWIKKYVQVVLRETRDKENGIDVYSVYLHKDGLILSNKHFDNNYRI